MATLADLRRTVQTRLHDWDQTKWSPAEIDVLLNEAQDRFTKETGYLTGLIVKNVVANTGVYKLELAGYRIGRIVTVKLYDGSTDNTPMVPISLAKLEYLDPDWRNRTASKSTHFIRNFDPTTSGPSVDTVCLYPIPDTAYTNGLRVSCSLMTDKLLVGETDSLAVPERAAEEAVINYAVAEALLRNVSGEDAEARLKQSEIYRDRFARDMRQAVVEAKSSFCQGRAVSRGYYF